MLEVIVIGAGRMGREHAHAISAAGDEVIAFLDPDLTRAESAAAEIGGEALAAEADLTGPLERLTRRGASAALIASPSVLHLAHAQAAISLGLPVLLEKPPWVPGQDPEPLLAAARQGAVLAVGMTTRFNPGVQAVRNAVRSGALGPLLFASDRVAFHTRAGGPRGLVLRCQAQRWWRSRDQWCPFVGPARLDPRRDAGPAICPSLLWTVQKLRGHRPSRVVCGRGNSAGDRALGARPRAAERALGDRSTRLLLDR